MSEDNLHVRKKSFSLKKLKKLNPYFLKTCMTAY